MHLTFWSTQALSFLLGEHLDTGTGVHDVLSRDQQHHTRCSAVMVQCSAVDCNHTTPNCTLKCSVVRKGDCPHFLHPKMFWGPPNSLCSQFGGAKACLLTELVFGCSKASQNTMFANYFTKDMCGVVLCWFAFISSTQAATGPPPPP